MCRRRCDAGQVCCLRWPPRSSEGVHLDHNRQRSFLLGDLARRIPAVDSSGMLPPAVAGYSDSQVEAQGVYSVPSWACVCLGKLSHLHAPTTTVKGATAPRQHVLAAATHTRKHMVTTPRYTYIVARSVVDAYSTVLTNNAVLLQDGKNTPKIKLSNPSPAPGNRP